jgi:hypothetical protein
LEGARRGILVAVLALAPLAACGTPEKPRRPAPVAPSEVAGVDPVDDAQALWVRIRTNAEKAGQLAAGDPNTGWLERALDADGRALFTLLSRPDFDGVAVPRDVIRARLLIVIKPPTAQDRKEAVLAVDQEFPTFVKRARAARQPS